MAVAKRPDQERGRAPRLLDQGAATSRVTSENPRADFLVCKHSEGPRKAASTQRAWRCRELLPTRVRQQGQPHTSPPGRVMPTNKGAQHLLESRRAGDRAGRRTASPPCSWAERSPRTPIPIHSPLSTLQQNPSPTSSRVLPLTPTRPSQLTTLPNFTFFDLNRRFGLPSAAAPGSPRPPRCRRSMNSCSELQPGRGQLGQGMGLKACRVLELVLGCSAPTSFFFSTRFYRSRVAPAGSRHTYYSDCSDPFNQR